jgi:hypothetical protein
MRIELLTSPGCPHADAARRVLTDCLATMGIDVPVIDRVGSYPSPTVLVDGVDVMRGEAGAPIGDACRLDVPTSQRVLDALRKSGGGSPTHRVALIAIGAAFLTAAVVSGCSTGGTSSPSTQASPTAAIATSTAASAMLSGSATTEPGGPPMSTGTIDLQSHAGAGLTEVGTDLFRLAEAANPGQLSFNWSYNDGNQPVTSSNCTVIAEVSGQDGFDQQQHSTDCTGSPAAPFPIAAAGLYSISVQLTPPGGGGPTAASKTITVEAAGS